MVHGEAETSAMIACRTLALTTAAFLTLFRGDLASSASPAGPQVAGVQRPGGVRVLPIRGNV